MIAYDLKAGQRFKEKGCPTVLICVGDEDRPLDWANYPGIVYRDEESGVYGGLGGGNDVILLAQAGQTVSAFTRQEVEAVKRLRRYHDRLVSEHGIPYNTDESFLRWVADVSKYIRAEEMRRLKRVLEG